MNPPQLPEPRAPHGGRRAKGSAAGQGTGQGGEDQVGGRLREPVRLRLQALSFYDVIFTLFFLFF